RVTPHHHHVQRGQRENIVDHAALGHVSEVQTRPALDPSGERRNDPEQRLDERGLAGAVGADDTPPIALVDREVDTGQKGGPPVADRKLVYGEVRGTEQQRLVRVNIVHHLQTVPSGQIRPAAMIADDLRTFAGLHMRIPYGELLVELRGERVLVRLEGDRVRRVQIDEIVEDRL